MQLKGLIFKQNFVRPSVRVDRMLLKQQSQQVEQNRLIFRQIVLCVEFLAKQGLSFKGNIEKKVGFTNDTINRGNFITTYNTTHVYIKGMLTSRTIHYQLD